MTDYEQKARKIAEHSGQFLVEIIAAALQAAHKAGIREMYVKAREQLAAKDKEIAELKEIIEKSKVIVSELKVMI